MSTTPDPKPEVPTPRTRAFTEKMRADFFPHALGRPPYLKAVALAEQLERENAKLTNLLKQCLEKLWHTDKATVEAARAAIKSATGEKAP